MKKIPTTFLQAVVVLLGIAALAFLIWEPQAEGVNANATNFETYFDPFVAFAYVGSIPFFAALYQTFKILGYVRRGKALSPETAKALRIIKRCAIATVGFVAVGEAFIAQNVSDDRAGGVAMGVFIAFGSVVAAALAGVFERVVREAGVGA
jgi:hypothetical protein